jgi:CBS domain-containing protein
MSPRAALRLERLGFEQVYDYVAGEADWLAFWLPWEGEALLAGHALREDVPTCHVLDRVADVRARLDASIGGFLVALDDDGVVMGVLTDTSDVRADTVVEDVMVIGPTTIRPSEPLAGVTERMRRRSVDLLIVTSSDGRLLGLLDRREAERILGAGREAAAATGGAR